MTLLITYQRSFIKVLGKYYPIAIVGLLKY